MKRLLLLILYLTNVCYAQKPIEYLVFDATVPATGTIVLQGSWGIDQLITQKDVREYTLYPIDTTQRFHYGNSVTFKPNGSFISDYSAKCGNDCFTTTTGKYKVINDDYVCLWLEMERKDGDCGLYDYKTEEKLFRVEQLLNLDLGLFRIYRSENNLVLRKSDGNPQQDQRNQEYIEMITSKYREVSECKYLKWSVTKNLTDIKAIADFAMAQNNIEAYEVLYDQHINGVNLILVKVENDFRYIIYDGYDRGHIKVSLYEEIFFEKIDEIVTNIENNNSLKETTVSDDYDNKRNPLLSNTIMLYKNKNGLQKVVYKETLRDYRNTEHTFYLKEGIPVAYVFKMNNISDFHYIYDWDSNYGALLKKPAGFGFMFAGVRDHYNGFMEVVKLKGG